MTNRETAYLLVADWHNTDPNFLLYHTKEEAKKDMVSIINTLCVDKETGECWDEQGRSPEECAEEGNYYGCDDSIYIKSLIFQDEGE